MRVGDDEVGEVRQPVEGLQCLERALDVDEPVEEEGRQCEAERQVREELVPVALHRPEDVDREREDGDEQHPRGYGGDRLQPGGRRGLEDVVVADAGVEEGDPPEADERERVAVQRRVGDAWNHVQRQRDQHRRQPEAEQVVRVPPVQHRVRKAVRQRAGRRAPDVTRSPDHVADRVVDREPQRTREEPPDRDVDRADRPDLDGRDDVDDVRAPDDEQGDVERPDQLAVLTALAVAGEQGDHTEQVHRVPGPCAPDPEPFAPHPSRAAQPRQHVEEGAEVHHRQPGEDHAVHMRLADAREREPGNAAEGVRRDEFGRENAAEKIDDGQPDDRRQQPVAGGPVGKPCPFGHPGGGVGDAAAACALASFRGIGHARTNLGAPPAARKKSDKRVIPLSFRRQPK